MIEPKKITAEDARYLCERGNLEKVLNHIIEEARGGGTYYYPRFPLEDQDVKELKNRGFKVKPMPQIAIQKDNIYYEISWKDE